MVCPTINPRLFPDQITYIISHAGDRVLFTDPAFVTLLETIADRLEHVTKIVVMTNTAHMPTSSKLATLACSEEPIAAQPEHFEGKETEDLAAPQPFARHHSANLIDPVNLDDVLA